MGPGHPYNLANTTRARYSQITTHQVIPHIGKLRMAEVTPADLKKMYTALAGKDTRRYSGTLSGQTIQTVHMVVRSIFKFAVAIQEDFAKNPAASEAAKPNKTRPVKKRAPDVEAVESFVALVREQAPEIAIAVMLAANLGTRRGETLALRWCDVDFDAGEIMVRRAVTQTAQDGIDVKETKTEKERIVLLDAATVAELRSIQREQREQRMSLGKGWQGVGSPADDYIAATPTGALLTPAPSLTPSEC